MKFYTYRQNNSGGGFDLDEDKGIGHYVIIEATDRETANERALEIGLYFDGVAADQDCECCGDRWSNWPDEYDKPSLYDEELTAKSLSSPFWEKHAFVHYHDGKINHIKSEEE